MPLLSSSPVESNNKKRKELAAANRKCQYIAVKHKNVSHCSGQVPSDLWFSVFKKSFPP
jgi:hypothetical protein